MTAPLALQTAPTLGRYAQLPIAGPGFLPFDASDDVAAVAETMLEPFPVNEYPNLVAFITEHAMKPGYDYGNEFEYGLDLILDGLGRARATG